MASFDIVSEVDMQEMDNAVNNTIKEIDTRYDFKNSKTTVELNKKDKVIMIVTDSDMQLKAIRQMMGVHLSKRGLDSRSLVYGESEQTSNQMIKCQIKIKEGLDKDACRLIVKHIKDKQLKVQTQIQDNQVRVTGKKIDDLQTVMSSLKESGMDVPLQFVNMKRD